MVKKYRSELLADPGTEPQDWTSLLAGQTVKVRFHDGTSYTAVIDTKTSTSNAVWVIRGDYLKTRQVFGHAEGVELLPIEEDPSGDAGTAPAGLAEQPDSASLLRSARSDRMRTAVLTREREPWQTS